MVADPEEIIQPKRTRLINKYSIQHTNNIKPKELLMIPDEVLHNILSRLSAKPLMRFKCVSTYWNSQITDSYFKSRRRILFADPFMYALNGKNAYSIVNPPYPFKRNQRWNYIVVVGTLNGILILAQKRTKNFRLILYNPLTRAAKKLPNPPPPCCASNWSQHAYGFGYGYDANPNDSKIVIAYDKRYCDCDKSHRKYCHVFSLKRVSWTTPKTDFVRVGFSEDVGVFLDGFLHWVCGYQPELEIVVLDVEDMKVLRIDVPNGIIDKLSSRLGTLHGRLCMVNKKDSRFDVWVMKTKLYYNKKWWSKIYSFTVGIERDYNYLSTIRILEDGRIVVVDDKSHHLIFYDPSKGSHNVFKCTKCIMPFATGIEYVESLASPSDICYFRNRHRVRY